jgi:hypothetical protein
VLIYPPCQARISNPPLGIAVIGAILKDAGFQVTAFDLNLAFYLYFISRKSLSSCITVLRGEIEAMEHRSCNLLRTQARLFAKLKGLMAGLSCVEDIDDDIRVMRAKADFLSPSRLRLAHDRIDAAIRCLDGVYYPAKHNFASFTTGRSLQSWRDVGDYVESANNPFPAYHRHSAGY